jgi:hypothetical protein
MSKYDPCKKNDVTMLDILTLPELVDKAWDYFRNVQTKETHYQSFFRPENLVALREIALRRTAQEVDEQLDTYMRETASKRADVDEHVLVYADERPISRTLIRRGRSPRAESASPNQSRVRRRNRRRLRAAERSAHRTRMGDHRLPLTTAGCFPTLAVTGADVRSGGARRCRNGGHGPNAQVAR